MRPSLFALAAVFAALFASMAVYVLRGRKQDPDAVAKHAQFVGGLGNFLLHWALWVIDPLVGASVRLGLTPDFYNYAGLLLGLAGGVLIGLGWLAAGAWAIVLCGVCDILDGRIARATGVASAYGDFIDSTFDRFVEVFVFLGFGQYLRATPHGTLLAGAALATSLVVSYARARGEVLGVLCTGGLMQRGERLVLVVLACLFDGPLAEAAGWAPGTVVQWMLLFVAVSSAFTAAQRTRWIARRLLPPA